MQQNLNPKGKKKAKQDNARNQRNGLAPAASGRRRLSSLLLACRGLRTLAHCMSPVQKYFHETDLTVLVSPEMAFTNFLGKNHKSIGQEAAWWQGTVGTASIHRPLCNAPITTRLLAQFEEIDILLPRCCSIIFPEISVLEGRTGWSRWLMSLVRSYCLEQLDIFVGASNFTCIGFVDGQRDNVPWDRKFIKSDPHGIFFVYIAVVYLVTMLWWSAVHCLHLPYSKMDVGFENRPHTENRLPQ